jgi:hypothetical protein
MILAMNEISTSDNGAFQNEFFCIFSFYSFHESLKEFDQETEKNQLE